MACCPYLRSIPQLKKVVTIYQKFTLLQCLKIIFLFFLFFILAILSVPQVLEQSLFMFFLKNIGSWLLLLFFAFPAHQLPAPPRSGARWPRHRRGGGGGGGSVHGLLQVQVIGLFGLVDTFLKSVGGIDDRGYECFFLGGENRVHKGLKKFVRY